MKTEENTDNSNSNLRPPQSQQDQTIYGVFVIMSAANLITSLLENVFFADVGYTLHRVIFMSVWGFFYFMYEKYRLV